MTSPYATESMHGARLTSAEMRGPGTWQTNRQAAKPRVSHSSVRAAPVGLAPDLHRSNPRPPLRQRQMSPFVAGASSRHTGRHRHRPRLVAQQCPAMQTAEIRSNRVSWRPTTSQRRWRPLWRLVRQKAQRVSKC
jgi:hypothetical protein